jgi:hypothetical protein
MHLVFLVGIVLNFFANKYPQYLQTRSPVVRKERYLAAQEQTSDLLKLKQR